MATSSTSGQFQEDFLNADRRRARVEPHQFATTLPFEIRLLRTPEMLKEIVDSRFEAYQSHHPENIKKILGVNKYDGKDTQRNTVLLYALEKETNAILGSMRIYTNSNRPFQVEQEYTLPQPFIGQHLASFGRLAIGRGPNAKQIKYALLKSAFLYCGAFQLQHWLLATVSPLDRLYRRIGFSPVFPESTKVSLHEANLKLDLLGVTQAQFSSYIQINVPDLFEFIFERYHPDIKLFQSVANCWESPRRNDSIFSLPSEN